MRNFCPRTPYALRIPFRAPTQAALILPPTAPTMWTAAAAVSAGLVIFLKKRGDALSKKWDENLEDLEANEDYLEDLKAELDTLTEQLKAQDSTVREVRAARASRAVKEK